LAILSKKSRGTPHIRHFTWKNGYSKATSLNGGADEIGVIAGMGKIRADLIRKDFFKNELHFSLQIFIRNIGFHTSNIVHHPSDIKSAEQCPCRESFFGSYVKNIG